MQLGMRDVDEAAGSNDDVAEFADVDVALGVDFGEAEEGQIDAAAVIEGKLLSKRLR